MNNRRLSKLILLIFIFTAFFISLKKTYSKFILTRNLATSVSSEPFYFEVKSNTERIYVNYGEQTVSLNIKNYINDSFNSFKTDYSITLEDNEFFTLDPINSTIDSVRYDGNIDLKLIPKQENVKPSGSVTLVVKTSKPYLKKIEVVVPIGTLGQYVLDIGKNIQCRYDNEQYGIVYLDVIDTDIACNGNEDTWDKPNYYKYISGSKECVNFNYVWYSGKMWRITEVLNDGSVKMITENILTAINYGVEPEWDKSFMKQWLNEDFLDTLYNHDKVLVENAKWDISGWYSYCWHNPPATDRSTVGLLNPYEFSKSRRTAKDFYLDLEHSWFLSSPSVDGSSITNVRTDGDISSVIVPNSAFGVRPVVVLKPDVKFTGNGTINDPFVLVDGEKVVKNGDLISTREEGELVKFNGMLYRIVSTKDYDGRPVTKLKSTEYIKDADDKVVTKHYGPTDKPYTYGDIVDLNDNQYWPSYLNTEWLTEDMKKYLVKDTYYLDPVQDDYTLGSIIGSYKNAICKEKDTTETTKDCVKTDNIWKGYVGLSIVGELFAYPLGGADVHDYLTATMTPYGNGDLPMIGAFDPDSQGMFQTTYDKDFAVKPCITLAENVIITSGDGKTPGTAFEIALPNE